MIDGRWLAAAAAVLMMGALGMASSTPPAPTLAAMAPTAGSGPRAADLGVLEGYVGKNPDDAPALAALAQAYLDASAPGLAEAAIARAASPVRALPAIAHVRARALYELGRAGAALTEERQALSGCAAGACSESLFGRASRSAKWLAELVRVGIDDPRVDPERALLAYRRSTREVRLDVR